MFNRAVFIVDQCTSTTLSTNLIIRYLNRRDQLELPHLFSDGSGDMDCTVSECKITLEYELVKRAVKLINDFTDRLIERSASHDETKDVS